MQSETVLGIDVGTNSVGWALIEQVTNGSSGPEPARLVDAGVRIFPEGVEANSNESRNQQRRKARALRRQHERRNRRRAALRNHLQRAALLPADEAEFQALLRENPYVLRAKGLDRALSPHLFGRALYHLAQRRGFKSNRKADRRTPKKDSEVVRSGISSLQAAIRESAARTLGEYLSRLDPREERIRSRYTSREMYEEEFRILWQSQQPHHPALLTNSLREQIGEIIFRQRPLRVQKGFVGECELEPPRKRSPKGTWYAQQFRLLQDVSHLEFADLATGEMRKLDDDPRSRLVAALQTQKEMTFKKIRELLGLLETQRFNFEQSDHREKLKGNGTEAALRKVFKSKYDGLSADTRDEIVRDLLFIDDEGVLRRHAVQRWGLSEEEAGKLADVRLESRYLHLSEKAIRRLLPHLERGLTYMDAVKAAGYERPDQREVRMHDELPLEDLPDLRNPIVMAAMHQVRRVVNAVAREYGRPGRIRVEMARDLKVSLAKRAEIAAEQRRNRERNEEIRSRLEQELGLANPSRDDVTRYKLWEECRQTCPYTGRPISKEALFSAECDVEHILPLPRSGDDSYMNKTLCWAQENREVKRDRTPWEAYGSDERRWDEILQRIRHLPYKKQQRFRTKNVDSDYIDGFIARQLNDTRYIAREARMYLETLVGKGKAGVGKGQITAELRRRWGLDNLLSDSGEKTRDDHRHHAVDAVVIALTTPAVVKRMSGPRGRGYKGGDPGFPLPWQSFRDDVKRKIAEIIVSHRVLRKVRGALHEETNYGILGRKDGKGQELFALRKRLSQLSRAELDQIADERVRETIRQRLLANGVDLSRKDAHKSEPWKKAMAGGGDPPCLPNRNGRPVPIRKVRLHKPSGGMIPMKNPQGEVYRAVESGSNHHVVVYECTDGREGGHWQGAFVSMFEAAQRARNGEPIIRREPAAGKAFVMSLSINEVVKVRVSDRTEYWRVQKIDAGNERITFRPHHDARKSDDRSMERTMRLDRLRGLGAVKITVDPLGREHPAHD